MATVWPILYREKCWRVGVGMMGIWVLALTATSHARDLDQEYKAQGLGLDTCATFLVTPVKERSLYYSWLAGYLTAYNYLVKETYSIAEYSGLARTNDWFEKYCGEHSRQMLHEAARQFVAENYRVRLKRKPSPADMLRFQQRIPR